MPTLSLRCYLNLSSHFYHILKEDRLFCRQKRLREVDNKLHRKIIKKCVGIAVEQNIELRQSYTRTVKKVLMEQRFRNHPKNKGRARKADRKIKTIAGRLVRELERKLTPGLHQDSLSLFKEVLAQKKTDSNKIYSLMSPTRNV